MPTKRTTYAASVEIAAPTIPYAGMSQKLSPTFVHALRVDRHADEEDDVRRQRRDRGTDHPVRRDEPEVEPDVRTRSARRPSCRRRGRRTPPASRSRHRPSRTPG